MEGCGVKFCALLARFRLLQQKSELTDAQVNERANLYLETLYKKCLPMIQGNAFVRVRPMRFICFSFCLLFETEYHFWEGRAPNERIILKQSEAHKADR